MQKVTITVIIPGWIMLLMCSNGEGDQKWKLFQIYSLCDGFQEK